MVTSTLKSDDGKVRPNATVTAAGTGGTISVYASDETDLILDVEGYFLPTGTAGSSTFHLIAGSRAVTEQARAVIAKSGKDSLAASPVVCPASTIWFVYNRQERRFFDFIANCL
jgi:hypothetical protein